MKKALLFLTLTMALLLCLTSCKHQHSFGEWSVTKNATCTEDGVKTRYCDCGEKQSDTIPAIDHKEQIIPAKESTCTEKGLTEGKKCSVCGEVLVAQEETPLKAHTEEFIPAVESTCTEKGLTEGKKCFVCGQILIAQQETPIITHTYDDKYDDECNVCGHKRDAECAHLETEVIPGKAATCTATGLTDGEKCKKCGEIFISQTVIGVKPHTEVIDNAIAATCTSTGLTEGKHCFYCNIVLVKQDVIPTLDHTYNTTYSFDNSFHWYACKDCGTKKDVAEHQVADDGMCTVCEQLVGGTKGIIYDKSDDGTYAMVVAYDGTASKIRIAETYQGLPVKIIYNYAFKGNTITSVIIPDSVTSIGEGAFFTCRSLTSVVMGDSVTSIGRSAFWYCDELTSVVIPNSVTSIGGEAFYGCSSLQFNEYENCKYLGSRDNPYCALIEVATQNLRSYIIHEDTNVIADYVFYGCSRLTSIVIPDGVASIGRSAFYNCSSLTSIVIPDGVTSIGDYAFYNCSSLTSVVIPNSVTSIGEFAFTYCSGLTSVVIPDSVTTIGEAAFDGCSSLTSVVMGDSVTSIGDEAFDDCSSLTSVVIPDSVTSIGDYAFYDCSRLNNVYYAGSEAEWMAITIGVNIFYPIGVTIHYNYVPEN